MKRKSTRKRCGSMRSTRKNCLVGFHGIRDQFFLVLLILPHLFLVLFLFILVLVAWITRWRRLLNVLSDFFTQRRPTSELAGANHDLLRMHVFELVNLCFMISLLHLNFSPTLIAQQHELANDVVFFVAFEIITSVELIVRPGVFRKHWCGFSEHVRCTWLETLGPSCVR